MQTNANDLDEVFETLWKNSLINSHVLSRDRPETWSLHTYLPYHRDCSTFSHLKLATFTPFNFSDHMNLSVEKLYPKKLHNFNKCPLYVSPHIYNPFSIVRNITDDRGYEFDDLDGFEVKIINEISRKLNLTPVLKDSLFDQEPAVIMENGTATGPLALV